MAIFHRHTRPAQRLPEREGSLPVVEHPDAIEVHLSPGLVDMAALLAVALGPGFVVHTEGPGTSGVMIVGPADPAGVGFLRVSHPGVVLLVVDRRGSGPRPVEAVAHLEAGADGYLANPPVAEVASHVRALARRVQPAKRPAETSMPAA